MTSAFNMWSLLSHLSSSSSSSTTEPTSPSDKLQFHSRNSSFGFQEEIMDKYQNNETQVRCVTIGDRVTFQFKANNNKIAINSKLFKGVVKFIGEISDTYNIETEETLDETDSEEENEKRINSILEGIEEEYEGNIFQRTLKSLSNDSTSNTENDYKLNEDLHSFAKDEIYFGIEISKKALPSDLIGTNNGRLNNIQYFNCEYAHGLFINKLQITDIKIPKNSNIPRFSVGDKVLIKKYDCNGTIRYISYNNTNSNESIDDILYGIELDRARGEHNGRMDGKWYFECDLNCGTFVKYTDIEACVARDDSELLVFGYFSTFMLMPTIIIQICLKYYHLDRMLFVLTGSEKCVNVLHNGLSFINIRNGQIAYLKIHNLSLCTNSAVKQTLKTIQIDDDCCNSSDSNISELESLNIQQKKRKSKCIQMSTTESTPEPFISIIENTTLATVKEDGNIYNINPCSITRDISIHSLLYPTLHPDWDTWFQAVFYAHRVRLPSHFYTDYSHLFFKGNANKCHKIDDEYGVCFKVGGDLVGNNDGIARCSATFVNIHDLQFAKNKQIVNAYEYQLPELPEPKYGCQCVYSHKHGLYCVGGLPRTYTVLNLKFPEDEYLETVESESQKNMKQKSNIMTSYDSSINSWETYDSDHSSSCDLNVVNNRWRHLKSVAWNLSYSTVGIIKEPGYYGCEKLVSFGGGQWNDFSSVFMVDLETEVQLQLPDMIHKKKCGGFYFSELEQRIYILGGNTPCQFKGEYFDIHKQLWFPLPDMHQEHKYYPYIFMNQGENLLHIVGNRSFNMGVAEFLDLRDSQQRWMLDTEHVLTLKIAATEDNLKLRRLM